MESENKFDRTLRELLNQQTEIPPKSVWEGIEQKRNKRKAVWFSKYRWAILLLILFPVATGVYLFNKTNESKNEIAQNPGAETENQQPELISQNPGLQTQASPVQPPDYSNGKSEDSKTKIQNSHLAENSVKKNTKKTNALISVGMIVNSNNSNSENENNENEHINQQISVENQNAIQETAGALMDSLQNVTMQDSLVAQQEEKTDSSSVKKAEEKPEIKNGIKNNFFSIEIYVSPEYANKQLSEKESQQPDYYLERRKESETSDNAFSTGLNIRYTFHEKYFVRAGIRYSQIKEKFYSKQTKYIETVTAIDSLLKGYIIDPFLPPVPYYEIDTTFAYMPVNYIQTAINRYTFIDIPVSAGIQIKLKRFDIYFSGGVEFNISMNASGKILAPDTIYLLDLASPNKTPVKNKSSMSIQSGFGFAYHISPQFDFMFEPNYRQQLETITKSDYPLNQKYSRIGIMAGVRYNIR